MKINAELERLNNKYMELGKEIGMYDEHGKYVKPDNRYFIKLLESSNLDNPDDYKRVMERMDYEEEIMTEMNKISNQLKLMSE